MEVKPAGASPGTGGGGDHDLHDDLQERLRATEERLADAERALFETEAKYGALLDQLPCAIYVDEPDAEGTTLYVSPQIEDLLGVTPEQYIHSAEVWEEMVHPEDRERLNADYEAFLRTGHPEAGDYRFLRPDGTTVWIHDRSRLIRGTDGRALFVQGAMFDVTSQKEAELKVQHLAYHDALTDLPNRAMFEEAMELALARAKRRDLSVAVLFLDLDDFKSVNDSLGHTVGDEVLKVVAERLRHATRATDLVVRQSGDEFIVLMADLDRGADGTSARAAVDVVQDRIARGLGEPLVLAGHELSTEASIGSAIYPEDGEDERGLMHHADAEMYAGKRERGGRLAG
ncbi:MAG: sensor domain-containing diguanylate cyclase [Actinomycetota bacterium]